MNRFKIILFLFILYGCTRTIIYKNYVQDNDYYSSFNSAFSGKFFVDKNIKPELKLKWNSSTYGSYANTIFTVLDTLLIVPDLGGRVTAFHTETGKKIGEIKYSGEISQAVIIYKSKLIFIVNKSNKKYAAFIIFDLKKGKEIKLVELEGKFNTELILIGENIIAVSDFGLVVKINISGEIIWKVNLDYNIYSNPASDGKAVFCAASAGNLISLNFDTGEVIYNKKIAVGFESGITIENNKLFLGDIDGNILAVNKSDASIFWKTGTNYKIVSNPGLDSNNLFIGNLNGDFYSLNKSNGKINSVVETGGVINTAPLIFNNIILQPNLKKRLYFIDKNSGKIINTIDYEGRCKTSPYYFNEKLYIGVDKGEIYCYSLIK